MGLTKLEENKDNRSETKAIPEYYCKNCGCYGYNVCVCQKKNK